MTIIKVFIKADEGRDDAFPIIYKYDEHPSLTMKIESQCLIISEVEGILLILPIDQLSRIVSY